MVERKGLWFLLHVCCVRVPVGCGRCQCSVSCEPFSMQSTTPHTPHTLKILAPSVCECVRERWGLVSHFTPSQNQARLCATLYARVEVPKQFVSHPFGSLLVRFAMCAWFLICNRSTCMTAMFRTDRMRQSPHIHVYSGGSNGRHYVTGSKQLHPSAASDCTGVFI